MFATALPKQNELIKVSIKTTVDTEIILVLSNIFAFIQQCGDSLNRESHIEHNATVNSMVIWLDRV